MLISNTVTILGKDAECRGTEGWDTGVCSPPSPMSWEPRAATLHLTRQESFTPVTNRPLPLCVFPGVI